MSKDLQSVSLLDILPSNLIADEQINAAAQALDDELQKVTVAIRETLILPRIDELPEAVVDLLAWQLHVDFYDELKSLAEKRNAVKQSIAMHRIKGTRMAVELALHMVYESGEVREWFEYGGRPYYFRVCFIRTETIHMEDVDRVIRIVYAVKNTRSWLESIGFTRPVRIGMYHGAAVSTNRMYRIMPPRPRNSIIHSGTYQGIGISVYKEVVLRE